MPVCSTDFNSSLTYDRIGLISESVAFELLPRLRNGHVAVHCWSKKALNCRATRLSDQRGGASCTGTHISTLRTERIQRWE